MNEVFKACFLKGSLSSPQMGTWVFVLVGMKNSYIQPLQISRLTVSNHCKLHPFLVGYKHSNSQVSNILLILRLSTNTSILLYMNLVKGLRYMTSFKCCYLNCQLLPLIRMQLFWTVGYTIIC